MFKPTMLTFSYYKWTMYVSNMVFQSAKPMTLGTVCTPCIVISWACVLLLALEYGSHGVERIQWLRQRIHFRVRAVDRSLHHAVDHPVRLRDFHRRNIVWLNDKIIICIIYTVYRDGSRNFKTGDAVAFWGQGIVLVLLFVVLVENNIHCNHWLQ